MKTTYRPSPILLRHSKPTHISLTTSLHSITFLPHTCPNPRINQLLTSQLSKAHCTVFLHAIALVSAAPLKFLAMLWCKRTERLEGLDVKTVRGKEKRVEDLIAKHPASQLRRPTRPMQAPKPLFSFDSKRCDKQLARKVTRKKRQDKTRQESTNQWTKTMQ
jgi:hypothetical protein